MLFHVLHPDEVKFPLDGNIRFIGLEGFEELMTRPHLLRPAYLRIVKQYLADIQKGCDGSGVDYVRMSDRPTARRGAVRVPRAPAANGAAMSAAEEPTPPAPLPEGRGRKRARRFTANRVCQRATLPPPSLQGGGPGG